MMKKLKDAKYISKTIKEEVEELMQNSLKSRIKRNVGLIILDLLKKHYKT